MKTGDKFYTEEDLMNDAKFEIEIREYDIRVDERRKFTDWCKKQKGLRCYNWETILEAYENEVENV